VDEGLNPNSNTVTMCTSPSEECISFVGHRHFMEALRDLVMPLLVHEDELGVLGFITTTLNLRDGLRIFGDRGRIGAYKEMKQLFDMHTFFPRDKRTLSREEKKRAQLLPIFLREKKTGETKGFHFVSGAPQREYIRKEDATPPHHGFSIHHLGCGHTPVA
jgi:hypothetical protein